MFPKYLGALRLYYKTIKTNKRPIKITNQDLSYYKTTFSFFFISIFFFYIFFITNNINNIWQLFKFVESFQPHQTDVEH